MSHLLTPYLSLISPVGVCMVPQSKGETRPALAPTRSRSSGSSASFLSRFSSLSSASTTNVSKSTTSPYSSQPSSPSTSARPTSPILAVLLPHLRTLRALSSRANDLTRSEAASFVAQLDIIAALHPNIGRDVRHGVESTFMRGGNELAAYLRWVVGEVERGVGLGVGGKLGSWGWDVDRVSTALRL